jgi:hypothetical protein
MPFKCHIYEPRKITYHRKHLQTFKNNKHHEFMNILLWILHTGCNNGRLNEVAWDHIQWLALILVMLGSVTMAFINLTYM